MKKFENWSWEEPGSSFQNPYVALGLLWASIIGDIWVPNYGFLFGILTGALLWEVLNALHD